MVVLAALLLAVLPVTQLYVNGSLLGVCSHRNAGTRPWRFRAYSLGHAAWGALAAACLLFGPVWTSGRACDIWVLAGCLALLVYPAYSVARRRERKDTYVPINNTSFAGNITECAAGLLAVLLAFLTFRAWRGGDVQQCAPEGMVVRGACLGTLVVLAAISARFVAMTGEQVDPQVACRMYLDKQV